MVAQALVPDPFDVRVVDLVSLENTHQVGGGTVMPVDELRAIRKVAEEAGVPVYLDGARIFNASVAGGTPVGEYAAEVDAMMLSLSKGLGAPIGSVVCGPAEMARDARRLKILYGGAWRQAGVVAAAALVALDEGPKRLHQDHERARRLAEGIEDILPGSIDLEQVQTNMVFVDVEAAGLALYETLDRLAALGVGATHSAGKVRLVTHLDVDDAGIGLALDAWRALAAERGTTT
jgi:threonine aldolase